MSRLSLQHLKRTVLLVLVAACADHSRIVAPPAAAKLELSESTVVANAIVCTRSWTNVAGGSWNVSTNWSPAGVPTSTDDVCITAPGTYTVTTSLSASVRTLTIGGPDVTGVQTLNVQGANSGTVITAANSIDNHGVITLTWITGTNGTASTLAVTDGLLTNHGTIRTVVDGIGAPRRIIADLLNLGTLDIGQTTSLMKTNGRYENRGAVIVQSGRTLSMAGANRFVQHSGTLTVTGSLSLNGSTFEFVGGDIVNDVDMVNATLEIAEGCAGVGAFTMSGANTLVGNVGATHSIKVVGTGTGSSLTSAGSFENAGTIELTWGNGTNGTASSVAVTDGILTNSGTIRTLTDGIGAPRFIRANVVNTGLVDIGQNTWLEKADGVFENLGAVNVQANKSLTMVALGTQTFRQTSGTITATGNVSIQGNTFEFNGGDIGNDITLVSATLKLGPDNAGVGDFAVSGASTLVGDIGSKTIVRIQGTGTGSTLTSAGSFTNDGIIEQSWANGTNGTHSTIAVTDGVLTNNGTIRTITDGIGAPRYIRASFVNNGTISIGHATTIGKLNGTYENRGAIDIAISRPLTIDATAGQTFRQAAGKLTVAGSMAVTSNTFEVAGGEILTNLPVVSGGTVRFTGAATGFLAARGLSTLEGDVPAGFMLRVSNSSTANAVLTSAGDFTNRGTIELTQSGGNNGTRITLAVTAGTITNEGTIRIMSDAFGGSGRAIAASFLNTASGTIDVRTPTTLEKSGATFDNAGEIKNSSTISNVGANQTFITRNFVSGTGSLNLTGLTMRASGIIANGVNLTNVVTHIGQGISGLQVVGNYRMITGGTLNIDVQPSPLDNDRMVIQGTATLLGTLNAGGLDGVCVDPNLSFEIMKFTSRSGDFTVKNLSDGAGRALVAVPGSANYVLNSTGPVCPGVDVTPPVITPTITGTLGSNGWYVSDVQLRWTVTDDESAITNILACGPTDIVTDTEERTQMCTATSAGGTSTMTVKIKRDATAPVVTAVRSPAANANGWNNTSVTATYSATDALSGLDGAASATQLFSAEGAAQSGSHVFTDLAGNTAMANIGGISIDMTAPTVSASRAPLANAFGWNNGDVTATYSATDALSGIAGSASATQLFSSEGANQSGSRVFTDLAGNSATATIGEISIDRTAPVVTVTRSPAPDATGWNNTSVTATWTASDALSGIDGSETATQLFDQDGASQSASRSFSDRAGNSASATISNINIDRTPVPPPVLYPSCSVTPSEIWPANNRMVAVRATIGGTGVTSYMLRSVTNNETGSGDVEGWTVGTADVDGSVLAKRNGGGVGRTYTLTYDVFGANGATGSCAVTVRVPHDQRR